MNDLQIAKLLAHAINTLGSQVDDDKPPLARCCSHECAPCEVLRDLMRKGELSALVRPYVAQSGTWDWWMGSPEQGNVRLSWFMHRMCGPATCKNRDEEKSNDHRDKARHDVS